MMKGSTEESRRANTNRVKTAGSLILASAMVFGPSAAAMAGEKGRVPTARDNGNKVEKPYLPELGDGCVAGAVREWAERIEKADGYDLFVLMGDLALTGGWITAGELLMRGGYGCLNETPASPPPRGLKR